MSDRTTRTTVTILHPFLLNGIGEQPPGTCEVEADEELIEGLSFPAYRRTATWISLRSPGPGSVQEIVDVGPAELEAILDRDRLA